MEMIKTFFFNTWQVLGQMSPYLLLGFFISGILSVFISPRWVEKHLGSGKFASVLKATLFGIPLPLCSCGVIPVAASIRKSGASKAATTSFLLSTPQTGVDSILATYGLLGPIFGIFRPLAALVTGLLGGTLVSLFDEDPIKPKKQSEDSKDQIPDKSFFQKTNEALKYGFITLPGDIAKALLIGIVVAGLISTFFKENIFAGYLSNPFLSMLIMLVIGIPLYVCSTSSIPLALGFMKLGVSPGAALVFLISGPATNAAAISVIWKILGKKSAIFYLLTVVIGAFTAGYSFDLITQSLQSSGMNSLLHSGHSHSGLENISAIILLAILFYSWYKATHSPGCCSSGTC